MPRAELLEAGARHIPGVKKLWQAARLRRSCTSRWERSSAPPPLPRGRRDERRFFLDFQSPEDNLVFRVACFDLSNRQLNPHRWNGGGVHAAGEGVVGWGRPRWRGLIAAVGGGG